jgi:hypothetical protein
MILTLAARFVSELLTLGLPVCIMHVVKKKCNRKVVESMNLTLAARFGSESLILIEMYANTRNMQVAVKW